MAPMSQSDALASTSSSSFSPGWQDQRKTNSISIIISISPSMATTDRKLFKPFDLIRMLDLEQAVPFLVP